MKIYYVYDALCGWCYGFSAVMDAFFRKYRDEISFEAISGGMVVGDRVGAIGEVAGYIRYAYKDVEKATGVRFGEPFLKDILVEGSTIFTSVPSAIAMSVFKSLNVKESVLFAGTLLRAIYYEGMAPGDIVAYGVLAEKHGLKGGEFLAAMQDPEFHERTIADFQQTADWGINGFPTLILENEGRRKVLSRGYTTLENVERHFLAIRE